MTRRLQTVHKRRTSEGKNRRTLKKKEERGGTEDKGTREGNRKEGKQEKKRMRLILPFPAGVFPLRTKSVSITLRSITSSA